MVHSLSRVDISQMMIEVLQDIIYYKSKSHKLPREYYDALKEHCKSHYNSVGQLMKQFAGITEQSIAMVLRALNQVRGTIVFFKNMILIYSMSKNCPLKCLSSSSEKGQAC